MATAAAPTYFPAFSAEDGQAFLDGGIWANCPMVVGLLEAAFVLGNSPASTDVLSIGTTEAPFDVSKKRRLGGFLAWNRELVTLLMQAQTDGALAQGQIITGKRATRIDATTSRGRFSLDDASQIESLRGLGTSTAKDTVDDVAARFLDAPADKFIPCHELSPARQPSTNDTRHVARRRRRRSLGIARTGFPTVDHRIVDISATGAPLETDGELPVGNSVELDLNLENGTSAQVSATITRVQYPRWGVVAGVAVKLKRFQGNGRSVIENYVEAENPKN